MAQTCPTCRLVHARPEVPVDTVMEDLAANSLACVDAQKIAMRSLLEKVGTKTTCRGCPATIYMVRHSNGATTPYTAAGLNHFIDCPARDQFARKKP